MWFAFALLLFSLAFVAWRALRPAPAAGETAPAAPAPSGRAILLFAVALGLATFAVRLVQPLGTNVLNLQLCYFPQYLAAFPLGLLAARHGWLAPLALSPQARRAGWIAAIGGPLSLLAILILGVQGGPGVFDGGWRWQAFALAMWEQLVGVGLSLGLLALFARRLNRETAPLRWLADRSFAVYLLHTPVLVGLFMLYRTLPQNPFALAALLYATGLVVSFVLADLARRTPGLRAIV